MSALDLDAIRAEARSDIHHDEAWTCLAPGDVLALIAEIEALRKQVRGVALLGLGATEECQKAADEFLALNATVARVRELHGKGLVYDNGVVWCDGCQQLWPCPTIATLTAPERKADTE